MPVQLRVHAPGPLNNRVSSDRLVEGSDEHVCARGLDGGDRFVHVCDQIACTLQAEWIRDRRLEPQKPIMFLMALTPTKSWCCCVLELRRAHHHGPRVGLKAGQAEARCFVHEAAIFDAPRKVSREGVDGAASVKETALA